MRSAIESQVDRELARRAVAGSMVYFVVCVVVAVSTPYYADHPVALVLAGCLMVLVGGLRLFTARRVQSQPASAISRNAIVFKGATYATFVVWGIFLRMDSPLVCGGVDSHAPLAVHRGTGRRGIVYAGAGPCPCLPLSDYSDRSYGWRDSGAWQTAVPRAGRPGPQCI